MSGVFHDEDKSEIHRTNMETLQLVHCSLTHVIEDS